MKIGLVGKPSVGKSSMFKALTLAEVEIADYPFTTIDANVAVGYVKVKCVCKEFGVVCNPRYGFCIDGWRFVPVEIIDVAGLVPGAHKGRGLGNKFLDDLRQADVLIHVVDASGSTNEEGEYVGKNNYDPCKDIIFLEKELDMWIKGIIEKSFEKIKRLECHNQGEKEDLLGDVLSGLKISKKNVESALEKTGLKDKMLKNWKEEDIMIFSSEIRKISKPIIIAANKCDVDTAETNIKKLRKEFPDYLIVPTSAQAEIALKLAAKKGLINYIPGESEFEIIDKSKLNREQKAALEFIQENVLEKYGSTGVQDCIDKAVFELLGYVAVFPGGVNKLADKEGNVLPDCFLMPPGSTALDFAYKIHEDLGKHFIKAVDVRTKKLLGKDYVLKHRDVIEIVAGK